MKTELNAIEVASQKTAELYAEHRRLSREFGDCMASGISSLEMVFLAGRLRDVTKKLQFAASDEFLARDAEVDRRIKVRRLSEEKSALKRFLIWVW